MADTALIDLVERQRKDDFLWLAQSHGMTVDDAEELWSALSRRSDVRPGRFIRADDRPLIIVARDRKRFYAHLIEKIGCDAVPVVLDRRVAQKRHWLRDRRRTRGDHTAFKDFMIIWQPVDVPASAAFVR